MDLLKEEDGDKRNPRNGALTLMNLFFSDEEMSSRCFKKLNKRFVKPGLDERKVKLLEGRQ